MQQQALALSHSQQVTVIAPEFARLTGVLRRGCAADAEETGAVYRPRCWYVRGIWWLFYLVTSFWCSRRIEWDSVDLVHAHWSIPSGFTAALLSRWYNKPFVLTEHAGQFDTLVKPLARRRAVHWTLKQAQRILVVSHALQRSIEGVGVSGNFVVIPNIVDPEIFFPLERQGHGLEGAMHLLWVGSFNSHLNKGVPELLEAVALARGRLVEGFRLSLAGDGAARQEMEATARQLRIDDICDFLGALPHVDVRDQMQQCDGLILSSLRESFGVVLIEAMACGKPVVATRCGGPEEIVTPEVGILVEPGSAQSLADGILQLHGTYESFDPTRIAAYAHLRFAPERVTNLLLNVYAEVLGNPRGF